jgi:hypothetical protein
MGQDVQGGWPLSTTGKPFGVRVAIVSGEP